MPLHAQQFESASADFSIAKGSATLTDGWILWPDARATVTGSASVSRRTVEMQARLSPIGEGATVDGTVSTSVALTGLWMRPWLRPAQEQGPANGAP